MGSVMQKHIYFIGLVRFDGNDGILLGTKMPFHYTIFIRRIIYALYAVALKSYIFYFSFLRELLNVNVSHKLRWGIVWHKRANNTCLQLNLHEFIGKP